MLHTFKHYHIIEHIERKPAWDIYRSYPAQEPEHSVILKIFDAECLKSTATAEHFQSTQARLQQLTHPSLVPVLDLGIEQGQPYIVTESLSGSSLRTYVQQRSSHRLTLDETFRILTQLGQAISYVHTQHQLHLNIRPESIFLTETGAVSLTDFSMPTLIDEKKLHQTLDDGMISYLAPEQLTGLLPELLTQQQLASSVGLQSDQYALGCLLYELLTGTLPCTTNDLKGFWQHVPRTPSTLVPILSRSIDTVILRALAKRSSERYADVATLLAALSKAMHPEPPAFPFARIARAHVPVAATSKARETLLPSHLAIDITNQEKTSQPTSVPAQQQADMETLASQSGSTQETNGDYYRLDEEYIEPAVHPQPPPIVVETKRPDKETSLSNKRKDPNQETDAFNADSFLLGLSKNEDTAYFQTDSQEEISPRLLTSPDEPDLFEEEPFTFSPAPIDDVKDSSDILSNMSISQDEYPQDGYPQVQLHSLLQEEDFTLPSALASAQDARPSQTAIAQGMITNDATRVLLAPIPSKTTLKKRSTIRSTHASTVAKKSVLAPQLRREMRRSTMLLILALLCSIVATLLASIFNPATMAALQSTSTASIAAAQLHPTVTPGTTSTWSATATLKPTKTPKPKATPRPTATPKPIATPNPTATPVPTVQAGSNPPPAPTATPTPGPTATTTNVARNATVTASSDFPSDGWSLAAVHDGQRAQTSTAPGWSSDSDVSANHSETLQFDFGSKQYIDEIDVYICTNNGTGGYGMPVDFTIDVSNDAQTWTTVVSRTNYPAPTTTALQSFGFNLQNVRYIRILGSSLRQSSADINQYRMQFAEVEVY